MSSWEGALEGAMPGLQSIIQYLVNLNLESTAKREQEAHDQRLMDMAFTNPATGKQTVAGSNLPEGMDWQTLMEMMPVYQAQGVNPFVTPEKTQEPLNLLDIATTDPNTGKRTSQYGNITDEMTLQDVLALQSMGWETGVTPKEPAPEEAPNPELEAFLRANPDWVSEHLPTSMVNKDPEDIMNYLGISTALNPTPAPQNLSFFQHEGNVMGVNPRNGELGAAFTFPETAPGDITSIDNISGIQLLYENNDGSVSAGAIPMNIALANTLYNASPYLSQLGITGIQQVGAVNDREARTLGGQGLGRTSSHAQGMALDIKGFYDDAGAYHPVTDMTDPLVRGAFEVLGTFPDFVNEGPVWHTGIGDMGEQRIPAPATETGGETTNIMDIPDPDYNRIKAALGYTEPIEEHYDMNTRSLVPASGGNPRRLSDTQMNQAILDTYNREQQATTGTNTDWKSTFLQDAIDMYNSGFTFDDISAYIKSFIGGTITQEEAAWIDEQLTAALGEG